MSNVFDARSRGPQFPQRRALKTKGTPFRKGGKVPGYFLGGLFGGSGGTSSTSSQSQTNTSVTDPNYNSLMDYVLSQGLNLAQNTPFKPYVGPNGETNPIVGLTPNQQQGITGAAANVGNYQPFFNAAQGQLGNVSGAYNPTAGQSYVANAGTLPTGTAAASPFLSAGTQTFPSQMAAYMSPYTQSVVQGIQDASNRNFEQNTLRSINDVFSGGDAASFGREQHGNAVGNAVFAKTQADNAAVANALESGYNTAGSLFNADQARQLQAGQTAGGLANQDISTQAGLGQTAAGIQGTNTSAGLGIAQGQTGLGAATQQGGINDINALEQTGAVGQNTAQNQSNFNYNQFQQQQQYPWQVLQAAQGLGQGWQLPTQSTTQSSSTSSVQQPQGSPFGQILGGALGLGSLATPGAGGTSALGNIFSGIKGWFSADGGYLTPDKQKPFAQGGMVPTIAGMRRHNMPMRLKGMTPTGMPQIPNMAPPPAPTAVAPQGQLPARGRRVPYADGGQVPPPKQYARPQSPFVKEPAFSPPLVLSGAGEGGGNDGSTGGDAYADGGLIDDSIFLPASEGLDGRNFAMPPRPFDQNTVLSDLTVPTGRDAVLASDPLLYLWRHLPSHLQDALSFGRDLMPDRAIEGYVDSSRDMARSLLGGHPLDAVESGEDALMSMMGLMAPGYGRAADRALSPFVRQLLGSR